MNDKNHDNFFDEHSQDQQASQDLLQMINDFEHKTPANIKVGSKVSGTVSRIGSEFIFVDIGGKNEAMIKKVELTDENGEITVKEKDKITAYVVSNNDSETILSKSISGHSSPIQDLYDALNNKVPVQGKVTGVNIGGLNLKIMGHRAFCPISQIDVKFTEDVNSYLGKNLDVMITRITEGGRNIVVSRIPLLEEGLKTKLEELEKFAEQKKVIQGKISKITEFGLFVDLGGLEGLVHISEVSWERAEKLDESFKVGQDVEVIVLKVEKKQQVRNSKISLSIKQVFDNPWDSVSEKFSVGQSVQGKVTRITNFGAFVELIPGVEGMVHVSEMSWIKRVHHPSEVVQEGNQVQVNILGIDEKKKSISLSLKDVSNDPWRDADYRFPVGSEITGTVAKKSRYGYFIDLAEGVTGLLVFANISSDKKNSLNEGDSVKVIIESVDTENRRISLSYGIKEAKQDQQEVSEFIKKQGKTSAEKTEASSEFGEALLAALKNRK
ncbi:MAG: S1 RNA-binding domain-containing protein [Fibrobacter sp.]|jgi:small subunit ribosomal protein S1|nr:S1 RNA-binding domain-containing protein [Fibrobacter sp.]